VNDTDAGATTTPAGTVSVSSDTAGTFSGNPCTLAGAGPAASCQVSYTPTAVGSGRHTLTAGFAGDSAHTSSSGQTALAVTAGPVSTTLACTPAGVLVGQPTTCTATVTDTGSGSSLTPTGTITFTTDRAGRFSAKSCKVSGTGAAAGCQVAYTPRTVGGGTHTLTAAYSGDAAHPADGTQAIVTVSGRATSTTVACEPTTLALGQATTCTATVTDTNPGPALTPTRTVRFSATKNDVVTPNPCTLSGGGAITTCQVMYTPSASGSGRHTLTARYIGDPTHARSTGQTTITVLAAIGPAP
jgi:hypothetical protein